MSARIKAWWRRNVIDTMPGYYSDWDMLDGRR